MTLIKYTPQALLNAERRSTQGWSINNVLLDLSGGLLSFAQVGLNAVARGDISVITGGCWGLWGCNVVSNKQQQQQQQLGVCLRVLRFACSCCLPRVFSLAGIVVSPPLLTSVLLLSVTVCVTRRQPCQVGHLTAQHCL
jgi:hypothetical protein